MTGPRRCGSAPLDANSGYVEVSHQLVRPDREWGQQDLLAAARDARLSNSRWPIGVVLDVPGSRPIPTSEGGIEVRVQRGGRSEGSDYWTLARDGSFYFVELFEEHFGHPPSRSSQSHPERSLWFDLRVWRIAEALLHSAALYRALGIQPDQPYALSVNHYGLEGRELYFRKATYRIERGCVSAADRAAWQGIVTQDQVKVGVRELVHAIAGDLFARFDFAKVPIDAALEDFLHSPA